MSLNWQFQNGTTEDLSDNGESLFGICTYMMLTGVPRITTQEEANLFMQRVTEAQLIEGTRAKEQLPRIWAYTEELLERGITTNVSKKTKTQWKTTIHRMIEDRAKAVIRNGVNGA